jgi:nucleoside-diphosphate-sugar epimerase
MISVYGASGFVGSRFCNLYPDSVLRQGREERKPKSNNILYLISTVDNYNVHTNITLDVETNLKVLCEVLDFCRDSNIVFNFVSSWFVYGETELPAKEEYFCRPSGFYSITKKAAEDLLISFCKTYGVNYRIFRLCNVKKNDDVYLYDDGTPIRDIMHVDDVCRAIKLIIDKGDENQIYNIGSGQPTTIGDIILTAKDYLKSSSQIKSREAPDFHKIVQAKDFWLDTTKLENLGFTQSISTQEIIKELCIN